MDGEWRRGALGDEISSAGISSDFLATFERAGNSNAAQRDNGEQRDWEVHGGKYFNRFRINGSGKTRGSSQQEMVI
jgi:hypothetical protein